MELTRTQRRSLSSRKEAGEESLHDFAEQLSVHAIENYVGIKDVINTPELDARGNLTTAMTKAVRADFSVDYGQADKAETDIEDRQMEVVDLLAAAGSDLTGAIVFAGWKNRQKIIEHILTKYEVDVNQRVPKNFRNVDGVGNGETVLHALVMHGNNDEFVKKIVLEYGADVTEPYDEDDANYARETALHIACVKGNLDLVMFFIDQGADASAQVSKDAKFFYSLTRYDTKKLTRAAYFGQSPLSFAVSSGNPQIVEYLLSQQKSPVEIDKTDVYGNTALHILALREALSVSARRALVGIIKDHCSARKFEKLLTTENYNGLSAVTIAAVLGDKDFLQVLIEASGKILWKFGRLAQYSFPLIIMDRMCAELFAKELEELDTSVNARPAHRGRSATPFEFPTEILSNMHKSFTTPKSVMDAICQTNNPTLMEVPLVAHLLEIKWQFCWPYHLFSLLLYALNLAVLSVATCLQPHAPDKGDYFSTPTQRLRLACEAVTLVFGIVYAKSEVSDLLDVGLAGYVQGEKGWPISILVYLGCLVGVATCRAVGSDSEAVLLSLFVLAAYFNGFYYLTPYQSFGPQIKMISQIGVQITNFLLIFAIMLVAVTLSFITIFSGQFATLPLAVNATNSSHTSTGTGAGESAGSGASHASGRKGGHGSVGVEKHMFGPDDSFFVELFDAVLSSWRIALGDFEYAQLTTGRFSNYQKVVWAVSLLVLSVVMLNLLIGLMAFVVNDIHASVQLYSLMQRAKVVGQIEKDVKNQPGGKKRLRDFYRKHFLTNADIKQIQTKFSFHILADAEGRRELLHTDKDKDSSDTGTGGQRGAAGRGDSGSGSGGAADGELRLLNDRVHTIEQALKDHTKLVNRQFESLHKLLLARPPKPATVPAAVPALDLRLHQGGGESGRESGSESNSDSIHMSTPTSSRRSPRGAGGGNITSNARLQEASAANEGGRDGPAPPPPHFRTQSHQLAAEAAGTAEAAASAPPLRADQLEDFVEASSVPWDRSSPALHQKKQLASSPNKFTI